MSGILLVHTASCKRHGVTPLSVNTHLSASGIHCTDHKGWVDRMKARSEPGAAVFTLLSGSLS